MKFAVSAHIPTKKPRVDESIIISPITKYVDRIDSYNNDKDTSLKLPKNSCKMGMVKQRQSQGIEFRLLRVQNGVERRA